MTSAAEIFFRLSQILTGVTEIDRSLAPELLDRLRGTPEAKDLDRLLKTFVDIADGRGDVNLLIRDRIMADPLLRELVLMTVLLWYTGDLRPDDRDESPPSERQHFSGVLWKIIGAHPPGLSGGYFGHWTYPPDNL